MLQQHQAHATSTTTITYNPPTRNLKHKEIKHKTKAQFQPDQLTNGNETLQIREEKHQVFVEI